MPWVLDQNQFYRAISDRLPFDAIGVGVLQADQPRVDELVAVRGWSDQVITGWCESGFANDRLYQSAIQHGTAVGSEGLSNHGSTLGGYANLLVHMLPESLATRRWWWLVVGRNDQPFSGREQQMAGFMLRQWQSRFNQVDEPGTGRLLIGHDDRLITADPHTYEMFLDHPERQDQLIKTLHAVWAQRWAPTADRAMREFAISLGDQLVWVRFRQDRIIDSPDGHHWYLELRTLEPGELPDVGTVEDERIAKSIAYIHDHFHQSPSLSQIAQAVQISPFHFHRLFTKQVGTSPKHYVQSKQLQMAKWLLRSSRESIGQIASQCGFASHGHFTSTFHRLVGLSPKQYRDKH